jgi:hypothetical protein
LATRHQRESSLPLTNTYTQPRSWSTPSTPALHELHPKSRQQQQMGYSANSLNSLASGMSTGDSITHRYLIAAIFKSISKYITKIVNFAQLHYQL